MFVNTIVYDPTSPYPNIGFDNRGMARRLADHLLDLGHTRIAMIAGPRQGNDRAGERVEGVAEALRKRGLPLPPERIVEHPYRVMEGRFGLRRLMGLDPAPTAIVCGNDVLAFGAVLEAQALGYDVPKNVSIAGFDDLDWASQLPPDARLPARYLIETLNGKSMPHATEVEVRLILRGSTGPVPKT